MKNPDRGPYTEDFCNMQATGSSTDLVSVITFLCVLMQKGSVEVYVGWLSSIQRCHCQFGWIMGILDSEGLSKHEGYAMKEKTSASFWNIIREHRTTFLVGALIPSVFGLFLAETVMAVQFKALQPILRGMTFLTVEVFGAWLVDFPLSVVAGCIITKRTGASEAKYGALAGAFFLTIFIMLVACIGGGLHQFTTFFDVFGLGNAVLLAAQTARQQLGFHLGVIVFMFMVSDYFLCMLGGILGFHLVRLIYPSETQES